MTYKEDIIRLREQEISALRNKVMELEAKNEVLNNQLLQWQQEK